MIDGIIGWITFVFLVIQLVSGCMVVVAAYNESANASKWIACVFVGNAVIYFAFLALYLGNAASC